MAYATIDLVTTLVPGIAGTDAEDAAAAMLEPASDYVDNYTGKSWLTGTVTAEERVVYGGRIQLKRRPITSVTSLAVVDPYIGAVSVVMTAGSGYRVYSLERGIVLVEAADDAMATVSYTAAATVPDDIQAATALLAAHWATPAVDGSGAIYEKIRSAEGAELVYRASSAEQLLPNNVKAILDGYRPAFAFA